MARTFARQNQAFSAGKSRETTAALKLTKDSRGTRLVVDQTANLIPWGLFLIPEAEKSERTLETVQPPV